MDTDTSDWAGQLNAPYSEQLLSSTINCISEQGKWDGLRNHPDLVCEAGHLFVATVTRSLLHVAAPGDEAFDTFDRVQKRLRRALTDSNIFCSFVPLIGMYTAYLWILRYFIQGGDVSWLNELPLEVSIPFRADFLNLPTIDDVDLYAMEARTAALELKEKISDEDWSDVLLPFWYSVERFWLTMLHSLSGILEEPELDLIPDFFYQSKIGEDIKEDTLWKERRNDFEQLLPDRPFRLRRGQGEGGFIHAKSQGGSLCQRLIAFMGLYENRIRVFLKPIFDIWPKLRLGEDLEREHVDDLLINRLSWQVKVWPEQFFRDKKLRATAAITQLLRGVTAEKARSDFLTRRLRKVSNESLGIRRGKGRTEEGLDENAKRHIRNKLPDLRVIHRLPSSERNIAKLDQLYQEDSLHTITQGHLDALRADFHSINPKDWDDLLVKLTQKILQVDGIGRRRYRMRDIEAFLKEILQSSPQPLIRTIPL